jgi:hypothetical protein
VHAALHTESQKKKKDGKKKIASECATSSEHRRRSPYKQRKVKAQTAAE